MQWVQTDITMTVIASINGDITMTANALGTDSDVTMANAVSIDGDVTMTANSVS